MYIFKSVLEEVIGDALTDPMNFNTNMNMHDDVLYRAYKFAVKTRLKLNAATDQLIVFTFSDESVLTMTIVNMRLEEIAELKREIVTLSRERDESYIENFNKK